MNAINYLLEIAVLVSISNVVRWLVFRRTTPLLVFPAKWKLILTGAVGLVVGALPWRLEHLDEGFMVSLCELTIYVNVRSLVMGRGRRSVDLQEKDAP